MAAIIARLGLVRTSAFWRHAFTPAAAQLQHDAFTDLRPAKPGAHGASGTDIKVCLPFCFLCVFGVLCGLGLYALPVVP
ncbi:MAG: hypothetical protein CVV14_06690 [Gammaproteobacteria bacterium HGW-Gammaproteobacteria-4]|jgi:uncharacterized membrane protein (UPF0182 family)|nr:MAG: hypothetical protein CVV14_06690 [Gammaproteobacteria bacterium HGW-Gammaproteobacteria-4]